MGRAPQPDSTDQQYDQPPHYPPPPPPQPNHAYAPQPPHYPPVQAPPSRPPPTYPPQPVQFPPQPAAYPPPQAQPFHQNAYHAPQPHGASFPVQNNAGQGYNTVASPYNPSPAAGQGFPFAQQQYNEGWRTGLFDCMDDPMNAVITACLPCVTFGQVAEIIDNGHTSCATSGLLYGLVAALIGCPCIMSCSYRTKLRAKYGLMEAPAPDWLTHCFCEWCALCQEYRELHNRGLDPAIGWQGNMNMQQQQPQVAMMPPGNQKMMHQ
ncbi:protein PLANT CADMIUM RESISTANCE 4-like [Mercurialis annua]|uniref:protein PLANT CADMIUM RESISTANCE 4-like n=1 Tax=Mercurialis annua TaxID=3986 RepID=UPI00215FF27A|nr:protein PLANT CADMIUM RESISTANCE 4-like [Mercurialis annua]